MQHVSVEVIEKSLCVCINENRVAYRIAYSISLATNQSLTQTRSYSLNINLNPEPESISGAVGSGTPSWGSILRFVSF